MGADPKRERKTPIWAILLVATCTIVLAVAQVSLKHSLRHATAMATLSDPAFWIGFTLLILAGLAIPFAMKYGELSVLHPVIALGFIWTTILSAMAIAEVIPVQRMIGIAVIVAGVSMIGHGGKR